MKKNSILLILGASMLAGGFSTMFIFSYLVNSGSLEETLLAIGLVSAGLSIIGIAIMYEFVRRKYDIRK